MHLNNNDCVANMENIMTINRVLSRCAGHTIVLGCESLRITSSQESNTPSNTRAISKASSPVACELIVATLNQLVAEHVSGVLTQLQCPLAAGQGQSLVSCSVVYVILVWTKCLNRNTSVYIVQVHVHGSNKNKKRVQLLLTLVQLGLMLGRGAPCTRLNCMCNMWCPVPLLSVLAPTTVAGTSRNAPFRCTMGVYVDTPNCEVLVDVLNRLVATLDRNLKGNRGIV